MIQADRFHANLAWLEKAFPHIHARVAGLTRTVAQPVVEDGVVVDIDLGNSRLYKGDARAFSDAQVRQYFQFPSRTGYLNLEGGSSDSMVSRRFVAEMSAIVKNLGIEQLSPYPGAKTGYLFVFGLGLGYHLPLLAQEIKATHVVVVEAMDEFVALSLSSLDWVALAEAMAARGQTLDIVLSADPVGAASTVSTLIGRYGEAILDGAFLFQHYPFWPLDEAHKRVRESLPTRMVGMGYYEDERKMIRHAAVNLHRHDHYLIRGRFRRRHDVPLFIVAAGPSLDEDIEFIRQWQGHAIVMSAGTAIQPLLKAGIIPDYHVELENICILHQIMEHILEQRPDLFPNGRFDGMKMIASVTVSPLVTPMFDELYFFYRDCAVSTTSLGEGVPVMNGVGPSISNTCMSVGAHLGFQTMYLFGTDCGWRDGRNHHSKATLYYTMDKYKTDRIDGGFSCPGNFGGTIHSNLVFTWTRDLLEQKIEKLGLKVFNCSDGAYIRGTTPLLAESLFFAGKPVDKQAVFDRIRQESDFYAAGQFLQGHDMGRYLDEMDLLRQDFLRLLEQARADGIDFAELAARIHDFHVEGDRGPYRHIYNMFQGSMNSFPKIAIYFFNRVPEELHPRLLDGFIDLFRDMNLEMFDEGRDIFAAAKVMIEGGPEPDWADGWPQFPGTTY